MKARERANGTRPPRLAIGRAWLVAWLALLLGGCGPGPWNNPYPASDAGRNIYYSSFSERPKHLDPARSYSSSEWDFISQIYEPPLQYHFLLRPYRLVPRVASGMPELRYLDAGGRPTTREHAAFTDYIVTIPRGVRFQPHPAFAREPDGRPYYRRERAERYADADTLADFDHRDSRELRPDDFVYQIKRLAFSRNNSPIAGLMAGHIAGFAALRKRLDAAYAALRKDSGEERPWLDLRTFDFEGAKVLDDRRYRIRIRGLYPQFRYWLAMNFFAPMAWEAERFYHLPGLRERNISLDWYPVGTGPYQLTENNPNLRMVLERNPNFHGERYPRQGMPEDAGNGLLDDAGRALPFIDRAVYSLEKESIPRWNKFLQGYYDASGIGSNSFDQAVRFNANQEAELSAPMKRKGIALKTSVEAATYYMGFNMKDPVIGGDSERARYLRQAISIAVDYEEYISIFLNGRGIAAQSLLPPGIYGHEEGPQGINPVVYDWVDGKPRRKPLSAALKLMEKAGYPGGRDAATGKPLVLYYDTMSAGPDGKAMLNWYRKQFAKLGIQLVIRATDYNRFQEKMRKGNAQIFSWGWNADYPDPENFFFLLFGPNGKVDHGGENAANYHNPEFDALFERMKNLPDGPERLAIIRRMNRIVQRDAPWNWGFHPKAFSLYHGWYHNAKPNLMARNTLKYRRIDARLRERQRARWNPPILWPLGVGLALFVLSLLPAVWVWWRRERRTAL